MKGNYPSGWEKKKKQKAKEQELQRLSGSILKFTKRALSHANNEAGPEEDPESLEGPSTSYGQRNEQTSNEEQEKGEEEQYKRQEEEDITNSICSESDANSVHESEDLTLNYDVGNWPTPMPDYLSTDVIRQGSEIYQNLEGLFDPVHKPGENSKGQTRQLTKSWFYKKLPSGEQILRKWMVYSHEKKSLFCFCCKLFDKNDNPTTKSSFITGFNSWWKLNPKVSDHENSELHINNLEKWKTLEARLLQNKTIDAAHQDIMEREKKKWRDILHRLLDITLFLAKQNLPFPGHREDFASENRGNFLEFVSLLSNYDPVLKKHSMLVYFN